ncbi:MAG: NifU family protein [Patescibacteria group bacterium]|nr:NifU family protein [Patescibacteria group bacterium]
MEDKIRQALERIRPALLSDGGDLEFVSFDPESGKCEVRFLGSCAGCPFAQMTLKQGVEKAVREAVPEVTEVVLAE